MSFSDTTCSFSFAESQIMRLAPESACLLIGQPGIGKTQFVEALAGKLGLRLVKLRCAEAGEAADLTGLLIAENGIHTHTVPKWASYDEPILLFLDEVNRAKKENIHAIMQLCTEEQEFNGHKLHRGSRVICAMNPSDIASNDVDELNRAMFSRCGRIYITPSKADWILWASTHSIHPDIIEYIEQATDSHLFSMEDVESAEDRNTVNPRAWENFSKMYTNGTKNGDYAKQASLVRYDAASWLGEREANEFYSWLNVKRLFNAYNYLTETENSRVKSKLVAVAGMLDTYRSKICDNVMQSLISILSDANATKYHRTAIHNFYLLLDRLNVEQASRVYTLYIEDKIKCTDKPDWITRLAHTDEAVWAKIKTLIQGKKKV